MICAIEWQHLFSALKIVKIGFIVIPSKIPFSEKYVWLTSDFLWD